MVDFKCCATCDYRIRYIYKVASEAADRRIRWGFRLLDKANGAWIMFSFVQDTHTLSLFLRHCRVVRETLLDKDPSVRGSDADVVLVLLISELEAENASFLPACCEWVKPSHDHIDTLFEKFSQEARWERSARTGRPLADLLR